MPPKRTVTSRTSSSATAMHPPQQLVARPSVERMLTGHRSKPAARRCHPSRFRGGRTANERLLSAAAGDSGSRVLIARELLGPAGAGTAGVDAAQVAVRGLAVTEHGVDLP